MKYQYYTNCVASTAEAIINMTDKAKKITYETFIKHVDWREVSKLFGYELHPKQGLTLKNDFCVGYYKSVYKGHPCYYAAWSGIEHIFI